MYVLIQPEIFFFFSMASKIYCYYKLKPFLWIVLFVFHLIISGKWFPSANIVYWVRKNLCFDILIILLWVNVDLIYITFRIVRLAVTVVFPPYKRSIEYVSMRYFYLYLRNISLFRKDKIIFSRDADKKILMSRFLTAWSACIYLLIFLYLFLIYLKASLQ